MKDELELQGRHAFVFGGTSGINLGIALAFARHGAAVTVASRKPENVRAAVERLADTGARAHGCVADVRDFAVVGAALQEATAKFGAVDVLVSGAAGNFLCEAKSMSSNGFKAVVDIDLIGTFHVLRQAYPHLRKPGASVINITAPQAAVPMRSQAHAAAAKAGVDQLTRVLALEWGEDGIRVNAISPGPIDGTEGFQRLMAADEDGRRFSAARVPLKRVGTIDDIADLALFLASARASYISGAVIPCDGGGVVESVKPALDAAARRLAAQGE